MKVLIIYDSRHQFTTRCLERLQHETKRDVELCSIRAIRSLRDWSSYDTVCLGGPVYFGRLSRRLTHFWRQASQRFQGKRLGVFVVSLSSKIAALDYLKTGLAQNPEQPLPPAFFFGGGITWKTLAGWERWILRRVRGIETDVSNLDLTEIQQMAAWLDTP